MVIADSLRRGMDSRSRSYKRPQPDLRRSKSVSQRLIEASEGSLGDAEDIDAPLKDANTPQESEDPGSFNRSVRTRARSLSNTLGGFLRGRSREEREAEDEEGGPSGL